MVDTKEKLENNPHDRFLLEFLPIAIGLLEELETNGEKSTAHAMKRILSEKCPPPSDHGEWIPGFQEKIAELQHELTELSNKHQPKEKTSHKRK